jgi:hypothetical protein
MDFGSYRNPADRGLVSPARTVPLFAAQHHRAFPIKIRRWDENSDAEDEETCSQTIALPLFRSAAYFRWVREHGRTTSSTSYLFPQGCGEKERILVQPSIPLQKQDTTCIERWSSPRVLYRAFIQYPRSYSSQIISSSQILPNRLRILNLARGEKEHKIRGRLHEQNMVPRGRKSSKTS